MARIRTIKPEFWEDEKLSRLSIQARLLFLGLISMADDDGRLRANSRFVQSQVFPYEPKTDVHPWLKELHELKLIVLYSSNGETFAWIVNFKKHQRLDHPTPSRLPAPVSHLFANPRESSREPQEDLGRDMERDLGSRIRDQDLGSKTIVEPKTGSTSDCDQIFEYWKTQLRPNARLLPDKTRRKVQDRLAEGFSIEDLKRAIDGCKTSPHHMGQNEQHKRYDGLELICRDGAHVDQFLGFLERPQENAMKNGSLFLSAVNPAPRGPPGVVDMKRLLGR